MISGDESDHGHDALHIEELFHIEELKAFQNHSLRKSGSLRTLLVMLIKVGNLSKNLVLSKYMQPIYYFYLNNHTVKSIFINSTDQNLFGNRPQSQTTLKCPLIQSELCQIHYFLS